MDLYFFTDENKVSSWWYNIKSTLSDIEIRQEFYKFNCESIVQYGRFSTVESVLVFTNEEDATAFKLKWG